MEEKKVIRMDEHKNKNKVHKLSGKKILLGIVAVLILTVVIIAGTCKTKQIKISGLSYYTEAEVKKAVVENGYIDNSVAYFLKCKIASPDLLPFIDSIHVRINRPDTITVEVKEKKRAGCLLYNGKYVYFDKNGYALESYEKKYDDVPLVTGLKYDELVMQEKIPVKKEKVFSYLLELTTAIDKYNLLSAVGWTVFITVGSVLVILVCTSMCAWYITRVKSKFTKMLYLLCVFSMVVPFQMVMFTLSLVADRTGLRTPWGIIIIYLGFGAGLAVFMFCGFVKSIPIEIEEAAMIDGCTPIRTFFSVVLPIMKPTYISVGILETMWIWNDFLLPYLVLDLNKYKTISIAIQYMKGSYGRVDMGAVMAALILAVIPVIIFYLSCQKHIIKGVAAGAVKG